MGRGRQNERVLALVVALRYGIVPVGFCEALGAVVLGRSGLGGQERIGALLFAGLGKICPKALVAFVLGCRLGGDGNTCADGVGILTLLTANLTASLRAIEVSSDQSLAWGRNEAAVHSSYAASSLSACLEIIFNFKWL